MVVIQKGNESILCRTYTDDAEMTITIGENSAIVVVSNGDVTIENQLVAQEESGVVYSPSASDWSVPADTTVTPIDGGINIVTTDNNILELTGYGDTLLSAIKVNFKISFQSLGLSYFFGVNAERKLTIGPYSIQSNGAVTNTYTGSLTTGIGFIYDVEVIIKDDTISHKISRNGQSIDCSLKIPMAVNEHNCGKFYLSFPKTNCNITDFKITNIANKGGNILIGDSVSWGRGANSFESNWWSKLMKGRSANIMAHGNTGFDRWITSLHELADAQPSRVWVMGSYVDVVPPGTLETFKTKYTQIVDFIKTIPSVRQINHLASFPSTGLGDIRPYNDWKKTTFNSGIDRYIDEYYPMLEAANGTGTSLISYFDWGGSHLKQVAQDIVYNSLTKYV
jgi:hypothetical protein